MSYQHLLTDDEKRELLRIARATLREYLLTGRIPPGKPHRESLVTEAAAFVTLRRGEDLRGCIGTQAADTPLYRAIQEMSIAAASRDPRFEILDYDELEEVCIEISVLGGHRPVAGPEEIEVGVHGLVVEHGALRGLLLPRVAIDNGWDAAMFLARTCEKAGLTVEALRDGATRVQIFTAQVFSDLSHPPQPRSLGF